MTAKKTIKKSLTRSKSTKTASKCRKVTRLKPSKFGKIEFDLTTEDGFENFKHAVYGNKYFYLIDSLYQEVFRPSLKYDEPLVNEEGAEMEITQDRYNVIRAILNKCLEHFKWEE